MMTTDVTLEQVDQLAAQLPLSEQRKLMVLLRERLSQPTSSETDEERQHREYLKRAEAFLRLCEESPAETLGPVDSAVTIRQIRNERVDRL